MAEPDDRDGQKRQLAASGLFDAAWYLWRNEDVAAAAHDPLEHYFDYGAAEGRWPNRYFDPAWYRQDNPDVAAAGVDPLLHYMTDGEREGRRAHPLFNPIWYRQVYGVPETQLALGHFVGACRSGRVVPSPDLFPVPFMAPYRDDPPAGIDPIGHYLDDLARGDVARGNVARGNVARGNVARGDVARGDVARGNVARGNVARGNVARGDVARGNVARGDVARGNVTSGDVAEGDAQPDLAVVGDSGLLDENYYLINAADVHEADIDPLQHYCRYGWRERRKPNIYFDPVWYTHTNPDVARLQINPLIHYILAGEAVNRRPVPFFDPNWYRTEYHIPDEQPALGHYLANRRKQQFSPTPLFDVKWYVARFGSELGPNRDPFAHYLQAGMTQDIDPSRWFNAARYRRTHLGRPSRGFLRMLRPDQHNPLVHHLRVEYEQRRDDC